MQNFFQGLLERPPGPGLVQLRVQGRLRGRGQTGRGELQPFDIFAAEQGHETPRVHRFRREQGKF